MEEAFIDESNLGCTSTCQLHPHETTPVDQALHAKSALHHPQILAQCWERLLLTTGGTISLTKCFWSLFHCRWTNEIASLLDPLPHHRLLLTEGTNAQEVAVPQKSVKDMFRTLGVHVSTSGCTKASEANLLAKILDCTTKITKAPLTKVGTLLSYKS